MKELFIKLRQLVEAGESAVLATVVDTVGAVPRRAGARMLVWGDGALGTVGGGAIEHQAELDARVILSSQRSRITNYVLRQDGTSALGMVCGGEAWLHLHYLPAANEALLPLIDRILELIDAGADAWLVEALPPVIGMGLGVYVAGEGSAGLALSETATHKLRATPASIHDGDRDYFTSRLTPAGVVYIFGGGHVSQALVPVLSTISFPAVILEDREFFTNPKLFPQALSTKLIDTMDIFAEITVKAQDYIIVMTRGHKDDLMILSQILRTPASYIGVIGSRNKAKYVGEQLMKLGWTEEDLERITTPIGLDIKAETPAEIAISIAGELIAFRATH